MLTLLLSLLRHNNIAVVKYQLHDLAFSMNFINHAELMALLLDSITVHAGELLNHTRATPTLLEYLQESIHKYEPKKFLVGQTH